MPLYYDFIEIIGTTIDDIEDEDGLSMTLVVKNILPTINKIGDDTDKVGGSMKASRLRQLNFDIDYGPFLIYDTVTGFNNYGDYLKLCVICSYNYVWLSDTNLSRATPSGEFFDTIFPIKVEMISDDLSPDTDHGCDNYKQTFRTADYFDVFDLGL